MFTGGYYTIERKGYKLRIIVLNSNTFSTLENHENVNTNEQLEWLETILNKSVRNKETVCILFNLKFNNIRYINQNIVLKYNHSKYFVKI